jgi:chaperonin GroEL (HSP60 family)
MIEAGIIDPAKVTRTAIQNSVSAASTLVTSANAIVEE